jgi:hypothetical protein
MGADICLKDIFRMKVLYTLGHLVGQFQNLLRGREVASFMEMIKMLTERELQPFEHDITIFERDKLHDAWMFTESLVDSALDDVVSFVMAVGDGVL